MRATFAVLAPVLLLMFVGIALAVALVFGAATARGPVMPGVPGGFTPPSMVMMEGGVAMISRDQVNSMLERVRESTTLPDASTLLGTWSKANTAKTTSFKGRRLDGWWIPGSWSQGPGGRRDPSARLEHRKRRLKVVTEKKNATTTTGSTSMPPMDSARIANVVVDLGGADGDLQKVVDTGASARQGLVSRQAGPAKSEPAGTEPARPSLKRQSRRTEPAGTEPAKAGSAG